MGIFSLTQELAIDLGTANTLIIHNGRVVALLIVLQLMQMMMKKMK